VAVLHNEKQVEADQAGRDVLGLLVPGGRSISKP
jgi:hypothetical protein